MKKKNHIRARATNIKKYIFDNPLWLEQTTHYLESFDNAGFTPRYFKVSTEKREKLKRVVARQKQINLAIDSNEFDITETLLRKKRNDC